MHRGHPERPARRAYPEHRARQARAAHPGRQAAAARPAPSGRGRRASSRRGERHREAYPRAGSARRARSAHRAHREAVAHPPHPDPRPDHPGHPDPRTRPGRGTTRAGWAHSRPPGYRAHPGRKAAAEACSPVARPAFPAHPAEAAAAPLHHADDAEAAPPCWSRRPRCHRRSARAVARACPDRPEAAYRDRPPKTRTGKHPRKNPGTRTEPRDHPARPRPAPAGSRTTNLPHRPDRTAESAEPERSAGSGKSEEPGKSRSPVCSRPHPRHPAPCHPPPERRARGRPPSAEAGCRPR